MKITLALSMAAIIGSAFAAPATGVTKRGNPEIQITFYKFDKPTCGGDGDNREMEHGDCKDFDYAFTSFYYQRHESFLGFNDNDFEDTRCGVVVYVPLYCI